MQVSAAIERLKKLASTPPVLKLASAFDAAGFEFSLVGGPVRDSFLGRPVHDLDFATDATPDEILRAVRPIADAVWEIGRAFGTIGARLGSETVEITTYRSDTYDGDSRKPVVHFGKSLAEDLVRRDFTVNALALRIKSLELVDPSGGIEDLLAGVLRTPSKPEVSFGDDPLRMMRAARFVSQLGFELEQSAFSAIQAHSVEISRVSAERIRDEISRLLLAPQPVPGIRIMVDSGLADRVLPELPALRLERDEHHRHKDVYEHSLIVLEQAIGYENSRGNLAAPDLAVRLAALLHDIGKPATRRFEAGGAVSFYHHDLVGAKLARKRLRELRYDNETIAAVSQLIELHLRFFGYTEGKWTDAAVRRYVRDAGGAGEQLERLHIVSRADVTTRNRRKADMLSFAYDDLEQRIEVLSAEEELAAMRPELDGAEIMRVLNIPPGRAVGEAYKYLLGVRLDEGFIGQDAARERLLNWWAERSVS